MPVSVDKAEELVPYRPLDPGRLKITGTASWDPSPYLGDDLWMAFQEPASLLWSYELPDEDFPDLSKEDYSRVLELVKIWDVKNLVRFKQVEKGASWQRDGNIRFFNCYKSIDADRMIGDRRIRNWREGRLPGVSRALPSAVALSVLEIDPLKQRFSISISDRKDFYHQFAVSPPRAWSNALWPPLELDDVRALLAGKRFAEELEKTKKRRYNRNVVGDHLGGTGSGEVEGHLVQACFSAIPQ